jgi:ATP-dependent Lon protease
MLPARNRRDFEDIPEEARRKLEFVWLERVEDAVASALTPGDPGQAASPAISLPAA